MSDGASKAMNRLEVVAPAWSGGAMLEKQGGDVDASALALLRQAIDCLEATIGGKRGLTDLKY